MFFPKGEKLRGVVENKEISGLKLSLPRRTEPIRWALLN
jgi:hypothetical protein